MKLFDVDQSAFWDTRFTNAFSQQSKCCRFLQDKGGWTNPEIAGWFNDYAELCYDKFGDRVGLRVQHASYNRKP